jgi:hypothetical protein
VLRARQGEGEGEGEGEGDQGDDGVEQFGYCPPVEDEDRTTMFEMKRQDQRPCSRPTEDVLPASHRE